MRFSPTVDLRAPISLWLLLSGLAACVTTRSDRDIKEAEIEYDLGVSELKDGRIRESLRYFTRSAELNPDFAQAHNGLGLANQFLGNNDEALKHYHRALELKPDYTEVMNNMARVYIDQGRYRQAVPLLESALKDVFLRERYLAEGNLGWALFQIGKEEEGMARVQGALAQNEKFCVGYHYLGLMHQKRKEFDEALSELSQLVKHCKTYAAGHHDLAKLLLMRGATTPACQHLTACKENAGRSTLGRECQQLLQLSCPKSNTASEEPVE